MNKMQKIILVLSVVTYLGMIAGIVIDNRWVLLAFAVASGILFVLFNMGNVSDNEEEEQAEQQEQLNKVSDELLDKSAENERLKRELAAANEKLTAAIEEQEIAVNEAKRAEEEAKEAREVSDQIREEAKEKQEVAVKEAVKEALAKASVSVDDKEYINMSAVLLPAAAEVMEDIAIVAYMEEIADEFAEFAKTAGIDIRVNATDKALKHKADKNRLRILFRNIIDNSIKYMKKSGSLVITISKVEEKLFIVFKDNGEGLSESETKHVFELNFQGSNRISGNGLGLTQAKAIVDYYGGTIYARSDTDNGMGIYVELP